MNPTVYQALTDPARLLGFLHAHDYCLVDWDVLTHPGAYDQIQSWLRDLMNAGAEEGVGAVLVLTAKENMTENDYPKTYERDRSAKAELVAMKTEIKEMIQALRLAEADEDAGVDERDLAGHYAEKLEGLV